MIPLSRNSFNWVSNPFILIEPISKLFLMFVFILTLDQWWIFITLSSGNPTRSLIIYISIHYLLHTLLFNNYFIFHTNHNGPTTYHPKYNRPFTFIVIKIFQFVPLSLNITSLLSNNLNFHYFIFSISLNILI